jgi:hypothetical protein
VRKWEAPGLSDGHPFRLRSLFVTADSHRRPFPNKLVRDLLGLVRLLYRAEQNVDMPESYGRLGRLEEAGRALREALELAKKSAPGTVGRRAAWSWAEKGVAVLSKAVRDQPELANLVRVADMVIRHR